MATPGIELNQAQYVYPRSGFTLECEYLALNPGEMALIVGKNGSGKTTLSKMMCGILPLKRGTLTINGENANGKSLGFIGKTVGYLFQNPEKQLFATSVMEELTFVPLLLGQEENAVQSRALNFLSQFNMAEYKDRSPFVMSRGEKQRLALCAILMQGASMLILDEPTTGLDSDNRMILHGMLDMLLDSGVGLCVITHDNEFRRRFHARTVLVEEGVVCV